MFLSHFGGRINYSKDLNLFNFPFINRLNLPTKLNLDFSIGARYRF